MEPIKLLLDIDIINGIKVILKAVRQWADSLIPEGSSWVSEEIQEYVKAQHDKYYHEEIEHWSPRRYWEDLIGEFYLRMRNCNIRESYLRSNRSLQKSLTMSIDERAAAIAKLVYGLSITQALDFFEHLVVEWVTSCDLEMLMAFVKSQIDVNDSWTEQKYGEFVLYHLAELTEH